MHSLISLNNLSFTIKEKILFSNITTSIQSKDRIGLVGNNGSGKTTLLRIISKLDEPTSGSVLLSSTVAYVPQFEIEKNSSTQNVYEYIQAFENWWEILEKYEKIFNSKLNPETMLKDLSGGELTKINIANAFCKNAELILMDEPTNHLDYQSVEYLEKSLEESSIAFLIASHDVDFLDSTVTQIWEIENGALKTYGGNYSDYKEQKDILAEAKRRDFEVAKKELVKLKHAAEEEYRTNERGRNKMLKLKKTGLSGTPKMALNAYKNRAEKNSVKSSERIEKLKDKANQKLEASKSIKFKKAFVDLKTTTRRGKLIKISNEKLEINNRVLIENINLDISYGDRISLSGANGSGKTLLARELMKPGHFVSDDIKVLYLSQKYENLDYSKTVFENISSLNIGYEDLRKVLANYLFLTDDDLKKPAKNLSGGETARLAMAKITTSEIDLLILDEPTNNLDISTIEILIEALNEFKGALLVISHNKNFLSKIGIKTQISIEDKKLII